MLNTIKLTQFPKRGITADSLKVGEYGRVIGTVGTLYLRDIVLKTKAGVVNLSDPSIVWDSPFSSPNVERLNTGDKLEITVGFDAAFEQRILDIAKGANGGFASKIDAIKEVREATNWGLKEAKDYVESLLLKF